MQSEGKRPRGKQAAQQVDAGLKQRAAAAKRPSGGRTDAGLLANILAEAAKAPAEAQRALKPSAGDRPASRKEIAASGERAAEKFRREQALKSYTSASRSERSRQVAAATARAARGKASDKDRLIIDAHSRRTAQSAGKAARTSRANIVHDTEVAADQSKAAVADLVNRLGQARKQEDQRSLISRLAASLVPGAGKADVEKGAKELGSNAKDIFNYQRDQLGTSGLDGRARKAAAGDVPRNKITAAGAAPTLPLVAAKNIVQVAIEDPSTLAKVPGDIAKMVKDIPAGVIQAAKDPANAGKGVLKQYADTYGPLIAGNEKEFREGLKKNGITGPALDVLSLGAAGTGAKTVSVAAKSVEKTSRAGSRVNRAASRVSGFVNDERPDKLVAPNKAVRQTKSANLPTLAVQRTVDARRRARVVRELDEAKAARRPLPVAKTKAQAKANRKAAEKRGEPGYGRGVRGLIPGEGQVVPIRAASRSRAVRKQAARVQSTAFRRMDRLASSLTRDAGRRFRSLSKTEQRAAVHALEGTINPADAAASIRAIDARVKAIKRERSEMRSQDPEGFANKYAPLVNDPNADELTQLSDLRSQLEQAPEKVLTPQLQQFVSGEQARRPDVERVAGDSLRPSTVQARRFAPVGELVGTRKAYEPRRAAIERLETVTPAKALADLGGEIKKSRASGLPVGALQAQVRAVREIAKGEPLNRRLPETDLDFARTAESATFVGATRRVAKDRGLGNIDPVFVKHRKRDTGAGAAEFTAGGADRGAVAGAKKSDLTLFKQGFRDTSDRAYELGIQESVKRSVQWRMVNELFQDLVPAWGKNGDKGFTLKEWQQQADKLLLDPQDWVAWRPQRLEKSGDVDALPADQTGGIPDSEFVDLKDVTSVPWKTTDRFFVIPRDAMGEMKRGGPVSVTSANRAVQKFTGVQSQLLLGSNPAYGIRQLAQNVPVTLFAVGGKLTDPVFYGSFKAYRRAAKVAPDQWADVQDILGVRSKAVDAVRTERKGATGFDQRRTEGALVHTFGGLFGASAKDYFVAARRSPGARGTASQAARTAGKTVMTPFRLTRDGNIALDAWQDRLARTLALAAQDAKMAKGDRWAQRAATSTGDQARKLGPLAAALELPPDELAKLARTPEFRRMAEDAADGVAKWLGDYANYTQREQRLARAIVPFYGFARYSTRLLLYTLPVEHPFAFAATLSMSGAAGDVKEQELRDYMKAHHMTGATPEMLAGLVLVAKGGGDLQTIDARWLNPMTGPMFELLTSGPSEASTQTLTPLAKGLVEDVTETNLFTKQKLSNANGAVGRENPLTEADQVRVLLNRSLGSLFPYRVANDLVNGDKGKLTDTSLLIDPTPYPYKPTPSGKVSAAGKRNQEKITDSKRYGDLERLLDAAIPGRAKPGTSLLNAAEYEAESKAPKKPRKKKAPSSGGGGGFGGGGFGGGGFGSGGGF